ncbi:MAG TPA: class I SAM-dependent methyltransferase, partial [Bacteroidales bacterium]|nr:class I SAM-dependent methyltransferase [Bacteroidales bacterium]
SKEVFAVQQCEECGFRFTQDAPEEAQAGRYYESEEYISHSNTSRGIINRVYQFSRNLMLRKKAKLVRKITGISRGTLLDIGSGTGFFAGFMKTKGWNVLGIEINEKARNFSRKEFGIGVLEPSEIKNVEPASFDCITLWHVLEHFYDPYKYMEDISRLLRPGGKIIIALPNSGSYDCSKYGEYWAAWDVPRHLWHFTPNSFRRFSENTGFEITAIKRLPLDVFYISSMSEKYMGSGLSFLKGMVTGFRFWLLSNFNIARSSSLIYILRKA